MVSLLNFHHRFFNSAIVSDHRIMEHHLRLQSDSPSPASDREFEPMEKRSRTELTHRDSDFSSSITLDGSKDFPSPYSIHEVQTDWTDEKHRSYLDSLETSFVKELHQSRDLRASCSQQKMHQKQIVSDISSSQLMVLQDGSWKKVNFKRNDPLDSTADSPAIYWMNHFASTGKRLILGTPNLLEGWRNCSDGRHLRNVSNSRACTRRSSQQPPTRRCDSTSITKEVSDQNFAGNHQGELSGSVSIAKRLKKTMADSSSNDQVVPLERLSSKKEKQNTQLPSEHSENFVPPKSDLCYY